MYDTPPSSSSAEGSNDVVTKAFPATVSSTVVCGTVHADALWLARVIGLELGAVAAAADAAIVNRSSLDLDRRMYEIPSECEADGM